jgi:hypothetical protein
VCPWINIISHATIVITTVHTIVVAAAVIVTATSAIIKSSATIIEAPAYIKLISFCCTEKSGKITQQTSIVSKTSRICATVVAIAIAEIPTSVHSRAVASILVSIHIVKVVWIVVMNWSFDRRGLDQIHNFLQALNTLLFLADNLRNPVRALWRNVGENL